MELWRKDGLILTGGHKKIYWGVSIVQARSTAGRAASNGFTQLDFVCVCEIHKIRYFNHGKILSFF